MGYKKNNVLVAMSGGVDSAAAVIILKNMGYAVKGVVLRMHDEDMSQEDLANGKLPHHIWHAREAARRMRVNFAIIDVRKEFKSKVLDRYVSEHMAGRVTDPCEYCNRHIIFPSLFKAADDMECSIVASGHYARVDHSEETGRYRLRKARDIQNDQSYMLWRLTQEQLARMLLPLGECTKEEVRNMTQAARLKNAKVPESRDICFIPDEDYENNIKPYFPSGRLISSAKINHINFVSVESLPPEGMRVKARIRYSDVEVPVTARLAGDDVIEIEFDEPVLYAQPGQSVVLYDGDVVAAGGIIMPDD